MLHQISWHAYVLSIITLLTLYYLYVGLFYYRLEFQYYIFRLTGKQLGANDSSNCLIPVPEYEVMGAAIIEDDPHLTENDELDFAPSENPDQNNEKTPSITLIESGKESHLIGAFSEMVAEVKTLIRVINESSETQENFEMLFKLIIQKYQMLAGTAYEQRVNEVLISESEGQFPFEITLAELEEYWKNY